MSCDWEGVARTAVETGTALEIDAYPDRQDLDVERLRIVLAAAIIAGISRDRVLNVRSAGEFAERVGLIRATKRRTNERNASVTAVGPGSRPRKEMKDSGK